MSSKEREVKAIVGTKVTEEEAKTLDRFSIGVGFVQPPEKGVEG